MKSRAKYNDGKFAKTHEVEVFIKGSYLAGKKPEINKTIFNWKLEDIKILELLQEQNKAIITNKQSDDERLYIDIQFYEYLKKFIPQKSFFFSLFEFKKETYIPITILAIAVITILISSIPKFGRLIYPLIPESVEYRIGNSAKSAFGELFDFCNNQDGLNALYKLESQLQYSNQRVKDDLEIIVLDSFIPNAAATPGNKMFILSGLFNYTKNPDELAGIMAHEIGHMQYKHSMKALSESLALSFIFGVVVGDVTNAAYIGELLTEMKYSRDAEREADQFAARVLNESGIGTLGISKIFKKITEMEEGKKYKNIDENGNSFSSYFSTHPETINRIKYFIKNNKVKKPREILSDEEWQAIKNICN